MPEKLDTYEQLEARLAAWAETQPTVRAVLGIGSRARGTPDAWSDLDVLIFTSDPEPYVVDTSWLGELGEVWVTYREDTPAGDPEWYALYEGGLKMDAVLMHVNDSALPLDEMLEPFAHWDAIQRGVNVLFDRLGTSRKIAPVPPKPLDKPSAGEFGNVVNGVLLASATIAKFITRGDYWRAQHWFAADLRPHLLTLLRWQALGKDTWYGGRFMDEWAHPRALAALPQVFPGFERESLQTSLLATLELCRVLGEETAATFGYDYPAAAHEKVEGLVQATFAVE